MVSNDEAGGSAPEKEPFKYEGGRTLMGIAGGFVRNDIARMMQTDGIWILGDSALPAVAVPIMVRGQKIHTLEPGHELDATQFTTTTYISSGPHRKIPPPDSAEAVAHGLMSQWAYQFDGSGLHGGYLLQIVAGLAQTVGAEAGISTEKLLGMLGEQMRPVTEGEEAGS